ncbi:MAG TPA: DUF2079 domain-containing protein [Myxococcota bacterium]|nr:DUF2079 domain-containing protein [Myxococcota bacterium]
MRRHLHWLISLFAAWTWWCSLQATAWMRIRTLTCVENYALAVYEQLFWNYSHGNGWKQTVHYGYVDHWMWSGHRSMWSWVSAWIYGLDPEPLTLPRIQIAFVALGALPAWGLARHVFGGSEERPLRGLAAGLIGLALYLGFPPLFAVVLNDYQDLILGVPFAIAAIWCSRIGNFYGFLAAALGCCMAREEWALLMPVIGVAFPGSVRQRARQIGWGILASSLWFLPVFILGHDFKGHDNPMTSHVGGLMQWPPPFTRTAKDFYSFYAYFLLPVQFMAVLSPLTLIPIGGTLFFHLTAPPFGGVDTQWKGHIHHMAPMCAFMSAASIEGIAWLFRKIPGSARVKDALIVVLALVLIGVSAGAVRPWLTMFGIEPQFVPTRADEPVAPEWALIEALPPLAVVATDVRNSLLVSSRPESYTYDESLEDKRPGKGLSIVDYALIKVVDRGWQEKARALGAVRMAETEKYVLYRFPLADRWGDSATPAP